jgi:hypothetical protein
VLPLVLYVFGHETQSDTCFFTHPPCCAHDAIDCGVRVIASPITAAEGLLDLRLCKNAEGRSNASLRDFEDHSRPIGRVSTISILPHFCFVRFECCG